MGESQKNSRKKTDKWIRRVSEPETQRVTFARAQMWYLRQKTFCNVVMLGSSEMLFKNNKTLTRKKM